MTTHQSHAQERGSDSNIRVAGLSPAKRALLELRMKKGSKAPSAESIPCRTQRNFVPLSFAQELLWLLDQLNPNLSVYSVPRAMQISGPLDVAVLERVLNTIVSRHEVLRTTFALHDDLPVQVIRDSKSVELRQVDLSAIPASAHDQEVQRLVTDEARRPFDLSRDLMLRALLLKLAPEEHVLYLGTHHIASDGWSKSVLFKEMNVLYGAYTRGQPSPLPELPIQYADFAIWQREQLRDETLEKQLAYWKRQLEGIPALLEVPGDRPRPAVQAFRGTGIRVVFPKALAEAFKALGKKEEATLFMVLLAAFDAFVYRYTGQQDVVLGTPIAGRNRPETEGLIGYFTNTLVLRSNVSGNPTYRELLARVKEMALAAYDHQDLPFEKLVIELKPERNLSYSPVFQILFSVGHAGAMVPDLPELMTTAVNIDRGVTKFDLTVGMTDRTDGLAVGCEYNTDLYDAVTIARMLESLRVLLEGVVANPDCRVSDLPLLPAAERERILAGWNDTQADFPQDGCIHRLIEAQAGRSPDAPAVCYRGRHLTYRELNARANQLAHYLRKRGVGPEVLVGLCVERSLEMAVGLLGVLKAGGAFLPLDPSYPKDRLDAMLRDARVPVLLTQQHLCGRLPAHQAAVVCLDADGLTIAAESAADPAAPVAPDHPAYVIYTSGSTGTPRGVVITHRSLVNHNLAAIQVYGLGPDDRVLQAASLSFDIAVEEIFPAWVAGAAVVLRTPDLSLAGPPFLHWLRQYRVTVLDLPTAFWHEWVQDLSTLHEPLPEALRRVIVGGEKAQAPVFAAWRKLAGDQVRWINTYGPTEATVIATAYEPAAGATDEPGELPIGRPIANTQAYILDRSLRPVPVNVTGELYLGGVGLARGYLHQPSLTAERFLPCPFGAEPGARMYRTGDFARFRADGTIEFMGRADHQVKLRGFRIEPGEIEAVLGRHPAVREAVVLAREDAAGPKRFVAYLVSGGKAPAARSLQDYLRERLPDYMVPAAFVFLPALPKTPNGKVDRRALPAPSVADAPSASAFVAPRDAIEVELAMLWESILGVRPVGVEANFFDLGGHSLLAVRMLAQVAKIFGKSLPLATLFQAPTIGQLADLLRRDQEHTWDTLIPIQPGGSKPPFFCVAAPTVNALGFVFLARHLDLEQPLYGLQSQHGGKRGQLYSMEEYRDLAAKYIAAMRKVQPQGPYYLGGTCEGSHIAFEMARQLIAADEQIGLLVMFDAWPLENTTSYFGVNYVHHYLRRFREWRRRVNQMGKHVLRKLTKSLCLERSEEDQAPQLQQPATVPVLPVEVWRARLWPGPDFVPPAIPGRITVFRTRKQPYWRVHNRLLGWGPWTQGGVEVHYIPGRHHTILREPNVRILAEQLTKCLDRAQGRGNVDGLSAAAGGERNGAYGEA